MQKKSFGIIFNSLAVITLAIFFLTGFTACDSKKAETSDEWRQLFNGRDLTGWKHAGPGFMTVEDGLIRGNGGMGILYWPGEKFGNCVITGCLEDA